MNAKCFFTSQQFHKVQRELETSVILSYPKLSSDSQLAARNSQLAAHNSQLATRNSQNSLLPFSLRDYIIKFARYKLYVRPDFHNN